MMIVEVKMSKIIKPWLKDKSKKERTGKNKFFPVGRSICGYMCDNPFLGGRCAHDFRVVSFREGHF